MRNREIETPMEKIAKRRSDIPTAYRGTYDRAMSGNSRQAAMHAFCLECMGWQREEVRVCTSYACPLFPYRPYGISQEASDVADSGAESTNGG